MTSTTIEVGKDVDSLMDAINALTSDLTTVASFQGHVMASSNPGDIVASRVLTVQDEGFSLEPFIGGTYYFVSDTGPAVRGNVISGTQVAAAYPWPSDFVGGSIRMVVPHRNTILLRSGSYHHIPGSISIPSFTTIVGLPGQRPIIDFDKNGRFWFTDVNECYLRGVETRQTMMDGSRYSIAILMSNSLGFMTDTLYIDGCDIHGGPSDTIFAGNKVGKLSVTNSTLNGSWDIFRTGQLRELVIKGNNLRSMTNDGTSIAASCASIGLENANAITPYPIEHVNISGNKLESYNAHVTPGETCGINLFEFQDHAKVFITGNHIVCHSSYMGHYTSGLLIEGSNAFNVVYSGNVLDVTTEYPEATPYSVVVLSGNASCQVQACNLRLDGKPQVFREMTSGCIKVLGYSVNT